MSTALRRGTHLAAVGAAVALMSGVALAAPGGGGQNVVEGHGYFAQVGMAEVDINAHGDPSGDAVGRFRLLQSGVLYEGEVRCLRVEGQDSVAGGRLSDGTGFLQYTTDAGPRAVDRSHTVFLPEEPQECPEPQQGLFVVTKGNYTVRQAQG